MGAKKKTVDVKRELRFAAHTVHEWVDTVRAAGVPVPIRVLDALAHLCDGRSQYDRVLVSGAVLYARQCAEPLASRRPSLAELKEALQELDAALGPGNTAAQLDIAAYIREAKAKA